jgi:hypothetical protein
MPKGLDSLRSWAGIPTSEQVEWASRLDRLYPKSEELDGRGDAARHLGLGWLAKQSDSPNLTSFLIQAREYMNFDSGRKQDLFNNALGFEIDADTPEEATREIQRLISDGQAQVFTPTESRARRGYQNGGGVDVQNEKLPYPEGEDPTAYRWTGKEWVPKSQEGWIGPRKHKSTGRTMTEFSIGNTDNPQDPEDPLRPSMVPTLTEEEIEFLTTLPEGIPPYEWKKYPLGKSVIRKSWEHYEMRRSKGLSPFLTPEEERSRGPERTFRNGGMVHPGINALTVDQGVPVNGIASFRPSV